MRNTKIAAVMALLVITTLVLVGCKPPTDPVVLDGNANLATLSLTGVTLSPAFSAATTSYTATVPYATASVEVSATAEAATSTVVINDSESPQTVDLAVGNNTITVVVTAEDDTAKTYTVAVTRAAEGVVLDSNANLASLSLVDVTLSPVFAAETTSYTASVLYSTASVVVSAAPVAETSDVTINGSASPQTVSLAVGNNTITVVVTAEDDTTKTYTVVVNRAGPVSLHFTTVESVNGSLLAGVDINAFEVDNMIVPVVSAVSDANGHAEMLLDAGKSYIFISSMDSYAENRVEGVYYDSVGNDHITMVNQRLGMITRPATAPRITGFYISNDGLDWDVYEGTPLDTSGDLYLWIDFNGASAVEPTAWSGFGAKVDFGRVPTTLNGISGTLVDGPTKVDDEWLSSFVFDLSGMKFPAGIQDVFIVGYDVANNRVQRQAQVEFTYNPAATSLDTAAFVDTFIDIRRYPVSRGWFGIGDSIKATGLFDGEANSYRTALTFKLMEGETNVPILGFDVYRKKGADDFIRVGRQHYGYLNSGSSGTHNYFDADSQLEEGQTYTYKIVAYTDSFNTKESATVSAKMLPAFSATLADPVNQSEVTTTGPDYYAFALSDSTLWDPAVSDYFYFGLSIFDKLKAVDHPAYVAYMGEFRYNFIDGQFEVKNYGHDPEDVATGPAYLNIEDIFGAGTPEVAFFEKSGDYLILTSYIVDFLFMFPIPGYAAEFVAGTTYEWDIFGDFEYLGGEGHPCWFEKLSAGGASRSYADGYSEGANTTNGRFEFTVIE